MRTELPPRFLTQMQRLLGGEYEDYLACFDAPAQSGLRVNTRKWTPVQALSSLGLKPDPVPWTTNGFYTGDRENLSKDPYYYAGLYYLQEPSAMAPAQLLPVEPGDRILDLCAAPGGKSTELGARLQGKGLLFANDISSSRAKGLLKNLELFGIPNLCVVSETPQRLAEIYPEYFDGILVDAPCSGEGMFRRSPDMVKDWLEKGPDYYAPVQRQILESAVKMLRPGGHLLYSTCTFSEAEDEGTVRGLLAEYPELKLVPLAGPAGVCGGIGLSGCLRFYPHRLRGEGHFLALMRRDGGNEPAGETAKGVPKKMERPAPDAGKTSKGTAPDAGALSEMEAFLKRCRTDWDPGRFLINGDNVYYLPERFAPAKGIRYLRTGLMAGTLKRGHFEPAQALAMTLNSETFDGAVSFCHDDERVVRYLKGETVFLKESEQERTGWCLVCVDGFGLGFARGNGRMLKNKYYPGWRWM